MKEIPVQLPKDVIFMKIKNLTLFTFISMLVVSCSSKSTIVSADKTPSWDTFHVNVKATCFFHEIPEFN
jgi:hypothetical protein